MSQYAQFPLDPLGVVADTNPHNVETEWTDAVNMRFNDKAAQKIGGEVLGAATTEPPYHLQFNGDHLVPRWYYMGDGVIRLNDFSSDSDISSTSSITSGTDWSSTLFNAIPVFNNAVDAPWVYTGSGDVSAIPAFPANTTCESIRPYGSFLIALNISVSSVNAPNRIIWSDASDAGALPASWDIADPTTLAGDAYVTSTKAAIVDGLQLRDLFIIYKTHAAYVLRLIAAQSVMKLEKIQINSGLLAKNCVQEFKGIHFVVSDGDVVLFDGQSIKSIADKRVRTTIFNNMDTVYFKNSYVTRYDREDEMWLCYPTTGQEFPNMAAIWNWKDDAWSFRELNDSRHIASGLALLGNDAYSAASYSYDSASADKTYSPVSDNPTTDTLISATASKLGIIDQSFDNYGVAMVSTLEKLSMDFGTMAVKIVKSITPKIEATAGTVINIRVGTQDRADDVIRYSPEVQFVVGTDREAHFLSKGRFISVRFRTDGLGSDWVMHGFSVELAEAGRY